MGGDTSSAEAIARWRAFVFERALWLCFALLLMALLTTYRDPFMRQSGVFELALLPGALCVGVALVWRTGPLRLRQLALIFGLMVAAVGSAARGAFLAPNAFCAHLMLVVLVALFMGRRAAWSVWGMGMVCWVGLAFHFVGGAPPPEDPTFDPTLPQAWVRVIAIYGVLSAATAAAVAYLLDRMVASVRRSEALYEALTIESSERIQALEEQRALEERLRQSQKLEALGTLAGGVAHDFNNLLVVIINNAELAKQSEDLAERAEALEQIQTAGLRAATLTGQLLAFGRRQVADRAPLDVEARLEQGLRMLRRLLPASIEVLTTMHVARARILAAAVEFDQVLMNLCINARDAMGDKGRLRISATRVRRTGPDDAQERDYVCLSVSDTGRGMDEQTRARLFEPFYTTKAVGEGTGLGLSMVHGIVHECGGFIEVWSQEGAGTEIRVYWPLFDGQGDAAIGRAANPIRGGSETIMVVDDDASVRAVIVRQLQAWGYRVIACPDGEEALREFRRRPSEIDLVMSDVVMPRRGGASLHDQIEAEFGEVPFLICSGYTAQTLSSDFFDRPTRAFLPKPFTAQALAEAVRSLLETQAVGFAEQTALVPAPHTKPS